MQKKNMLPIIIGISLIFSIISISSLAIKYTSKDKSFHMIYEVREGEKLSDVAYRFNVSEKKLKELNDCGEYIAAGTRLKIESN